jgi:TonB family protein
MNAAQIWNNVVAYALQIGIVVAAGAIVPTVLRMRTPRAKLLLLWQGLIAACIVLPWVQPWREEVVSVSNISALAAIEPAAATWNGGSVAVIPNTPAIPFYRRIPATEVVLYVLVAGTLIRLIWLMTGLLRLAGYRQRGQQLTSDSVFRIASPASARWLVSAEIQSPVTFGWRDPVILLPMRFTALQYELREAILCHELVHVERRDWVFTLAEEIVRAVFWFHPAIWWVLGEIQLAREQTVDEAVVEITHSRGQYVDALLAMASSATGMSTEADPLDLAPAPLFLRRRHLKRRVFDLLQEVRMAPFSKVRLVLSQAVAAAAIVTACWMVSESFPLSAAPQLIADSDGVVINTGGAKLLHRTPVSYPAEALEKGIQGTVSVQAAIGTDGELSDETVVRCPPELCDAATDSLPNWRFDARQGKTKSIISIDFVRPAGASAPHEASDGYPLLAQVIMPVPPGLTASTTLAQAPGLATATFLARTEMLNGVYMSSAPATASSTFGQKLAEVRISGLSDSAASQLRSRIPAQAGDIWTASMANVVTQVVNGFQPNLEVEMVHNPGASSQWTLWIGPAVPPSGSLTGVPSLPAGVYLAGNGVKPPTLIRKMDPAYAGNAASGGISGTVALTVDIGADGTPGNIQVIAPLNPDLDRSAADALAKWRFGPGSMNGTPVSVRALVNMSFRTL